MLPALTFTGTLSPGALRPAAEAALGLASRPEVASAWQEESACAGMTVGALAAHLLLQAQRVVEVLGGSPGDPAAALTVDEHYAQVSWRREDLDGPSNVAVRDRSAALADPGPEAVLAHARTVVDRLDATLADAPPAVLVPWQGTVLSSDDFVVTRLLEILVHSEDLAASVGVPTPEFSPDALWPVVTLLTNLALRRHGQDALLRTLARPQRAPASVSAF
ncbi:maleylpyruvate isomerase N-terminal domain-containing protein [Cellulomonas massiliensis]|uniref:maleylpyruvate isomerase N-terminal domain-containing protein n=1 Tax=Cellulomonas massiliensis TaxID=1465811 RepID=UPI00037B89F5|nr:maleylpyruvate isomerase N-terminal domain-containing protein [Cellulomonas massiliensis]